MCSNHHDISRIDSAHWKALRTRSSPERDILLTCDEGNDGPSVLPLAEGIRLSKTSSECLYFQTAEMKKKRSQGMPPDISVLIDITSRWTTLY